ncbi:hypothetical protein GcC1_060028 [Golovinomyces cichoracearum]|uniref:Uncharacterized protein n=1 Tax=Golovinomyces cichoracearum TaxID=62708 RepID=A0A420ITH9_9PEZI|nr:hypothetical protein GcC1_060028 [Golovinomyces cichoracearum]
MVTSNNNERVKQPLTATVLSNNVGCFKIFGFQAADNSSKMSSSAHKFDQLSQQIKLITADGITPAAILKDELDNWNLYNV